MPQPAVALEAHRRLRVPAEAVERWAFGRSRVLFNVPGDPIAEIVRGYRETIDALAAGESAAARCGVRSVVGPAFTRGHFARAV